MWTLSDTNLPQQILNNTTAHFHYSSLHTITKYITHISAQCEHCHSKTSKTVQFNTYLKQTSISFSVQERECSI